jgi:hypothetical protein
MTQKVIGEESAVYLEDILTILGWSRAKFFNKREELKDAGAIFYRYEGRPPRLRLCAFPSEIRTWIRLKASKGEII